MPTCRFKPDFTSTQNICGQSKSQKLSFFKAENWEGPKNRWRVMEGRKWIKVDGEKYTFFTKEGVMDLIASRIGLKESDSSVSSLVPLRTPVKYYPDDLEEDSFKTFTRTLAKRDERGEFMLYVFFKDQPVPLRTLEYVQ